MDVPYVGLIGFTVPDKGRSNTPHRQGGRNRAPSFFVRESHLGIRGGLHDGICATARCTIKQGSNCLRTTKKRITPRRSLGHFRALLRVPEKCRKMAKKLLHLLLICNFVRRRLQPKIRALMKKAAMRWLWVVIVMKKIGLWATIFYIQRIKIEFL